LLWNVFNFVFFRSYGKRDSQIKVILVGLSLSPLLLTEHFRNLAQKSKNNNYRKNCKPNRYQDFFPAAIYLMIILAKNISNYGDTRSSK